MNELALIESNLHTYSPRTWLYDERNVHTILFTTHLVMPKTSTSIGFREKCFYCREWTTKFCRGPGPCADLRGPKELPFRAICRPCALINGVCKRCNPAANKRLCSVCSRRSALVCGRCKELRYCSQRCQKRGWRKSLSTVTRVDTSRVLP